MMISGFRLEIWARRLRSSSFRIEKKAVELVAFSPIGERVVVDAEEAPLKTL